MCLKFSKTRKNHFFLILLLMIFHGVSNIVWLTRDDVVVNFVPHFYYATVLEYIDSNFGLCSFFGPGTLYYSFLSIICFLLGKSIFVLNFTSTVLFILLIFATYLLSEKIQENSGVYSAFLISFYPFVFGVSRMLEFHLPLMLNVLFVYYYCLKVLTEEKGIVLVCLGILGGIVVISLHYQQIIFILHLVSPISYFLIFSKKKYFQKTIIFFLFLLVTIYAVREYCETHNHCFRYVLASRLLDSHGQFSNAQIWKNPYSLFYGVYDVYVNGSGSLFAILASIAFIVLVYKVAIKRTGAGKEIFLIWCVSITYIVFLLPSKKVSFAFLSGVMPFTAIISGIFFSYLTQSYKKYLRGKIFLFLLEGIFIGFAFNQYFKKSYDAAIFPLLNYGEKMDYFIKQQHEKCHADTEACYRKFLKINDKSILEILKQTENDSQMPTFYLAYGNYDESEGRKFLFYHSLKEVLVFNYSSPENRNKIRLIWKRAKEKISEAEIVEQIRGYLIDKNSANIILVLQPELHIKERRFVDLLRESRKVEKLNTIRNRYLTFLHLRVGRK